MPGLSTEQVADIQKKLEKKYTFKDGVKLVTNSVCGCELGAAGQQELLALFPLVQRTHQLLKARHTSIDFWKAGNSLFSICQHLKFSPDQLSKLRVFSLDAEAFITEDSEGAAVSSSSNTPTTESQIMDMLMDRLPAESHFDDAGLIIDEDSDRWRRAQISGTHTEVAAAAAAAAAAADGMQQADGAGGQQQDGSDEAGDGGAPAAARTRRQVQRDMQRQILEGIQSVYSGMEAVTRGTEAIGRELDSVLEMLNRAGPQQQQGSHRPPASRKVIASLPLIAVTQEKLAEWGPECMCAVCTCEVVVGDEIQVLPCKHMYHPVCVAPWLRKNNSCPVCRTELPTDDPHYEARKEKEIEDEAERRGAANAVRGGEHMYM